MHALDEVWDKIKHQFDAACSQMARAARHGITNELNQTLRRLRQYGSQDEWLSAVLDGASHFVAQVALLELKNGVLYLRGAHNLHLPHDLSFPVNSAPAFASAVESKDTVIALRIAGEVTAHLSGPDMSERAHIFPISNGSRVVALLFAADHDSIDSNALELIAGFASIVLERQSNSSLHAQIAPSAEPAPISALPSWADLPQDQRDVHIRAQRFSRVAVAEWQLSRPEACHAGRAQSNLYVYLKNEIDKAREKYREQFMTIPSMVDYLHLELVRVAGKGDEMTLGADYPGELV